MVPIVTVMAAGLLELATKSGEPHVPENERSSKTPDSAESYLYDRSSPCPEIIRSCCDTGDQTMFDDFLHVSGVLHLYYTSYWL
jgi:hypothetical protein